MFTSPLRTIGIRTATASAVRTRSHLLARSAALKPTPFSMFSNRNLVTISSSIVEGLKKHEIFPDVLDEFIPQGLLTINYGKDIDVVLGNTLKVKETQNLPLVQFTLNVETSKDDSQVSTFSANDYFTLVLTDPDAPSRTDKKWSEYAHYIKTNIKLIDNDSSKNDDFLSATLNLADSSSSPTYVSYQGPAPPPETGKHRYVFLLFRQKEQINPAPLKDRPNWGFGKPSTGVKIWASQNNLEPVAANFFYAQNEKQ